MGVCVGSSRKSSLSKGSDEYRQPLKQLLEEDVGEGKVFSLFLQGLVTLFNVQQLVGGVGRLIMSNLSVSKSKTCFVSMQKCHKRVCHLSI